MRSPPVLLMLTGNCGGCSSTLRPNVLASSVGPCNSILLKSCSNALVRRAGDRIPHEGLLLCRHRLRLLWATPQSKAAMLNKRCCAQQQQRSALSADVHARAGGRAASVRPCSGTATTGSRQEQPLRSRQRVLRVCGSLVKRSEDVHTGEGPCIAEVAHPRRLSLRAHAAQRSCDPRRPLHSMLPPPPSWPSAPFTTVVSKLPKPAPRDTLRMGLPSKGRMAEDTIQLLKVCMLPTGAGGGGGMAAGRWRRRLRIALGDSAGWPGRRECTAVRLPHCWSEGPAGQRNAWAFLGAALAMRHGHAKPPLHWRQCTPSPLKHTHIHTRAGLCAFRVQAQPPAIRGQHTPGV